jgi:hypothetical protein
MNLVVSIMVSYSYGNLLCFNFHLAGNISLVLLRVGKYSTSNGKKRGYNCTGTCIPKINFIQVTLLFTDTYLAKFSAESL